MKKETVKRVRKAARAMRIPPTKVKPSGKKYNRKEKHRARYDQDRVESGLFDMYQSAA